jgi:hypothetical protein
MLYRSYGAELSKFTERQLTSSIVTCCISSRQTRTTELNRIVQDPVQPVQAFLASLKSKARQCDMKLECSSPTCQQQNDYSETVIMRLFKSS